MEEEERSVRANFSKKEQMLRSGLRKNDMWAKSKREQAVRERVKELRRE